MMGNNIFFASKSPDTALLLIITWLTHLYKGIDNEFFAYRLDAIAISRASSGVLFLSLSLCHYWTMSKMVVIMVRCCRGQLVLRVGADGVLATSIYAIAYHSIPTMYNMDQVSQRPLSHNVHAPIQDRTFALLGLYEVLQGFLHFAPLHSTMPKVGAEA